MQPQRRVFKYKKTFSFEGYLDKVPRNIRLYVTRLRTSSHNFPVEVLRYVKPKIMRRDRKCDICNIEEKGDEHHFLLRCNNSEINKARTSFIEDIKSHMPHFINFSDRNIIEYCLTMVDNNTHLAFGKYVKAIFRKYREDKEEKKAESPKYTRSGRLIKKPDKLNL